MYELKINNLKVGVFKTLRDARAYEPTMADALEAGIDMVSGSYVRIIKKLRTPIKSFSTSSTSLESNQ
jgi:hypothetical protein